MYDDWKHYYEGHSCEIRESLPRRPSHNKVDFTARFKVAQRALDEVRGVEKGQAHLDANPDLDADAGQADPGADSDSSVNAELATISFDSLYSRGPGGAIFHRFPPDIWRS